MSELVDHLAAARQLDGAVPGYVRALRQRGAEQFGALGVPTTRHEDWKYTNLAPLARQAFQLAAPTASSAAAALVDAARLDGAIELVFVNGHLDADLSRLPELPGGVAVTSLADAMIRHTEVVAPLLGSGATLEHDGLAALNAAFVADGGFVHLADGVALDTPIHCLFLSLANGTPTVSHPRTLIAAGAGSRATVIEQHLGDGPYWTNAVTEIALGAGAALTHHKVQRESAAAFHRSAVCAAQAGDSRLDSHAVSLGARLARADIATRFDAPGAACSLDGLYLAGESQHVDHHTSIDHRQPRGTSRELYKGILAGRASGVFNGKVFVRPDAQQTDAQQMNQNLLLSDDAQIDTKPQLEIFADDVKCSHGATIGQLDEDAVFYLRARGIDAGAARHMLIVAFANELVQRIAVEPLRRQLDSALAERLPALVGASA
ncbi:MAG: Fe-S cluster assembly protein SufD [Deltaproteobacteria bacterium]|nr:Fe-S cluster assembly protein SufD [Deltaproteobacteria bacterium]